MKTLYQLLGKKSASDLKRETTVVAVQNLFNEGKSMKKIRLEQMAKEREDIIGKVKTAYGINEEEFQKALSLGKRAVDEYRAERTKEAVHCAGLPSDLLKYIQGQINKIEDLNFVYVTQAWRMSPALMEWCVGTLFSEDGSKLEDCMIFECNLVISKFWIRILGIEMYEAIIDHELVHLEQNHVNLEQHILKTLCKLKDKQHGLLDTGFLFSTAEGVGLLERWRRRKVLQEYLMWLEFNADQKPSVLSAEAALRMHTFLSSAWLSLELFDSGVHPSTRKRREAVEEAVFSAEAEEWLEKRKICRNCPDFQNCQTNRSIEKIKEARE